ncbi:MAG TPA: putative toxin-antitoxin system toxin component, PIN family [Candidatus Deferrimicrobiaceae bacterium]|nr:putative toxin-antitoxin system toxin component, PIN family [Candidatus Deferrimicrobiaceae bacterium]
MLWGGKPAEIVKAAEQGKVCLIISEEIIEEISQVLSYPKLKKVYEAEGLPHQDLIEAVLKVGKFVQVTQKVRVVLDHPSDDKFIDCALASKAGYIVSGDKHLLKIGCYRKIPILSVSAFLLRLKP